MFKIITDSTTDLPKEYLEEHDVGCLPISYDEGRRQDAHYLPD